MPATGDIVDVAAKAGTFTTLLAAAKAAGLVDTLKGKGPLTVLAPTDAAFAKLPKGTVEMLLKPENKHKLAEILKYHVIEGRVFSDEAKRAGMATTLLGKDVKFTADEHGVRVQNANVVATDLDASNGVIHVIDTVLMPK